MAQEQLPEAFRQTVETVATPLADMILERRPKVVGLCGAQGSGKSTLAQVLGHLIEAGGLKAVTLSLDDLYLTRAERQALALDVHPLFATRGVPGTHDVALGIEVISRLVRGENTDLPVFDKSIDDRAANPRRVTGPVDIVLLEGWCVGAAALPDEVEPLNELERQEDPDGIWQTASAAALAGPYQDLFSRIEFQILLAAPGFEAVLAWRQEQEAKLRARTGRGMSDAVVARFIQHYERLTRWILREMPSRADVVIELDAVRSAGIRPPSHR
jgi:D-glycerate 3-kinase